MTDRVRMEPAARIRVELDGVLVAETEHGFVVHETGLPPRYYVPRSDVTADLSTGTGDGVCPWKGTWRHLDVTVAGTRVANGAWTYFETKPVTDRAKDFIAFYESKFSLSVQPASP